MSMTILGRVEHLWDELQEAKQDVEDIRGQFLEAVVIARDGGFSQPAIGERLGLSKQRVQQLEVVGRRLR